MEMISLFEWQWSPRDPISKAPKLHRWASRALASTLPRRSAHRGSSRAPRHSSTNIAWVAQAVKSPLAASPERRGAAPTDSDRDTPERGRSTNWLPPPTTNPGAPHDGRGPNGRPARGSSHAHETVLYHHATAEVPPCAPGAAAPRPSESRQSSRGPKLRHPIDQDHGASQGFS